MGVARAYASSPEQALPPLPALPGIPLPNICQIVAPILDQLAGEYVGRAKVTKLDVDANQRTAMRFNVRSIPSILFFKNGQHVDTVIGAVPKATLEGKIKQHLA